MGHCSSKQNAHHELEAMQHLEEQFDGSGPALKKLAMALKETNEQVYKTPMQHPELINLGMIMKQCTQERRYTMPNSEGGIKFAETAVLMKANRYTRYAKAAYASEQEDIIKAIHGGEEDFGGNLDILHVHRNTAMGSPLAFFLAHDKASNDIVMSIQGRSVQDAIGDAVSGAVPFLDGSAHETMLQSASEVIAKGQEVLENALRNSPSSSVAFVGHGIGAGIAILVALQSCGSPTVEKMLAQNKVKCYAFAPPPTFAPPAALPGTASASIYTFIYNLDLVPRITQGTVGKLLMAVRTVDELTLDTQARVQALSGHEGLPESLPDHMDVPEELSGDLKHLYHVGTILLLFKDVQGKMGCEKVKPEQFDQLFLSQDMVKDHSLDGYQEALTDLLTQIQRSKGCC